MSAPATEQIDRPAAGRSADDGDRSEQPRTSSAASARRADIELLRVLAVIGVIAIHVSTGPLAATFVPHPGLDHYEAALMGALGRWAVPVFLAVAGWALLARRPADNEERWLGRRAVRLVLPLLAWSLIYVVWALALARLTGQHLWSGKSSFLDWLRGEAQLFYSGTGVRPQLWFMYALIVATLIVWLVQTSGRIRNRAV